MEKQPKKKFSPLSLVGMLLSIACLGFALYGIKWNELGSALARMSWLWCVPAVGIYLLGHLFRGVRCSLIVSPHAKISFLRATQVVLIGYAANNVLPARLGEIVRGYALGKREGIPQGTAISTVFIERIFDGLAIVGILAVVCLTQPVPDWARKAGWAGAVLFLGVLAVLIAGRLWREKLVSLFDLLSRPLPSGLSQTLRSFLIRLMDGADILFKGGIALRVVALSFLIWIVEGAMFLVLLPAFGMPMAIGVAYFALAVTNLGVLVPSSPGHVGTFHFICAQAVGILGGAPPAVAVSYAVLVHALQYIPVTAIGMWALYNYGFTLSSVRSMDGAEPTTS